MPLRPFLSPLRASALALGLCGALLELGTGSAGAQQAANQAENQAANQTALADSPREEAQFQAWQLTCFAEPAEPMARAACAISTRFDLRPATDQSPSHNTLLVFSVTFSPATEGPVGIFSLPLGVYLPSGLALVFGGSQSLRLPFETCNQTGCHAGLLLNAEVNELLQAGPSLEVMFQNERQQTIKLPLSLEGYAAAAQALAERQAAS